jgi:hypothetical protein
MHEELECKLVLVYGPRIEKKERQDEKESN